SRKHFFAYKPILVSIVAISLLTFLLSLHHFFTIPNTPPLNSFFSITTIPISLPTPLKIFNSLFTIYPRPITFTSPILSALPFIPNFLIPPLTPLILPIPPP
uniref:cbb3-type cytochrome c oxidase subunit I n=1 Tax=Bacillus pumilus TaxID=1408 RepID=UPI001642DD88